MAQLIFPLRTITAPLIALRDIGIGASLEILMLADSRTLRGTTLTEPGLERRNLLVASISAINYPVWRQYVLICHCHNNCKLPYALCAAYGII